MAKPIELHYWPTPNGWKISIALEEMGLPYDVKYVNIGKGEQFEPGFLAIAPNNRMPAIIDPEGPDGEPVSIFESGAILQYLGRKSGKFYGSSERERIEIDQWLFWQMAGVGPNAGQVHHFRNYADEKVEYATTRFINEVNRLYGVLDTRLKDRDFIAGDYSIADMATWPWVQGWERQGQDIAEFPHMKAWLDRCWERPAVQTGRKLGEERRMDLATDAEAKKVLFGQRARPAAAAS
ncbi:glutathione S-transferase N-terminal domain-containing protein [Paralimibaculum aggregatum]|uniref:Glutathione S-transferase N-terminal domain-containing protein n=1 Tax=Paralimibaculum aggregatum TaxID=3036245 RepID=A0ABQ6LEJ5_9RHOB|nr:glutathione S-transferase N-terminal domain-containing protein [Limibaculum sp. NKW23]GMG81402.1 glutathione S-transferase N-terminal domain-containing protein [Limibaculum sp. NKW23]